MFKAAPRGASSAEANVMAVAPPVPRLPYLPVSTPAAAAASLRRLGAAGGRSLSGGLYGGPSALQASSGPEESLPAWHITQIRKGRGYTLLRSSPWNALRAWRTPPVRGPS